MASLSEEEGRSLGPTSETLDDEKYSETEARGEMPVSDSGNSSTSYGREWQVLAVGKISAC